MNFISTPIKEKAYSDDRFLIDESEEGGEESPDKPKDNDDEDGDEGLENY